MSPFQLLRAFWVTARGVAGGWTPPSEGDDPLDLFREWFESAKATGISLPEAMTLATASPDGQPDARMVLLKRVEEKGFGFFTNYGSSKANDLDANPRASLVFHWSLLQRQIRIQGSVERMSREDSQAYFHSRPRGSQIGAWASRQSAELSSREELKEAVRATEKRFDGQDIPLPNFWGGYWLRPSRIEFWQGRLYRLHDRVVFERNGDAWASRRLYP